jgi:ERF superfamily
MKKPNGNGQQLAVPEPSIAVMLQTMLERGITTENIAALEQMTALYERMEDRKAEKEFAAAFNSLMSEIPQIEATKSVPNNDGSTRYRFAPLEEIDSQLRPLALKHGFTYFFSEAENQHPGRITKVCTIQHAAGHKRSTSFTVRTSAPPKASDTQADGSTHSYAKRGALCDAFGIIISHDDDARMIGKPIGKALAEELRARVKALGDKIDEQRFLAYAGVACSNPAKPEDYEQIADERWDALDSMLTRKERGQPMPKKEEKDEMGYVF